ncbi:MAG: hypothetical protein JXM72_11365 [Deltaproteobacteria bacterium]|nr:hypothetical protein [Deltaproteobacteria bacterium]
MMLILTGEKGCGKTFLIRDLVFAHNIRVQGFLSLKEITDGEVTGISLLILPKQKMFPLATTSPIKTTEKTSRFYFYPKIIHLVNRHFHHIKKGLPFVFDEFGFLEMYQKGHFPIFENLIQNRHKTLMIVRRNLLDDFLSSYCRDINFSVVDMGKCDRQYAQNSILAFLNPPSNTNHG